MREIENNYEIAQQVLKTGDFLVLDDSLWDPKRPHFVVEIENTSNSFGVIRVIVLAGWNGETPHSRVESTLDRVDFNNTHRRRYWIAEPGDKFYDQACAVSMKIALIDRKET